MNSFFADFGIVVYGSLPPPMNGQARITGWIVDRLLEAGVRPLVARVVPRNTYSAGIDYGQLIRKTLSVLKAMALLIFSRIRYRKRHFYLAIDGGKGALYTNVLIIIAKLTKHRIFFHHHTFDYLNRRSVLHNIMVWLGALNADHVFLCHRMKERYEKLYGSPQRSFIVANIAYADAPNLIPQRSPSMNNSHIVVGFLSNLCFEKGLYDVLNVMRKVSKKNLPVRGVLAGPVVSADAKQELAQALEDLRGSLNWVGPVYGKDKDAFYDGIDVFLFPTRYRFEAQPNVVFEALAHAVPVITFGRGCIPNDVESRLGIVVNEDEAFEEKAIEMLNFWCSNRKELWEIQQTTRTTMENKRMQAREKLGEFLLRLTGSSN